MATTKAAAEKVIFAEEAATVHILDGDVETLPDGSLHEPHYSRVLLPGESVAQSEVPSYLLNLVKEGKAPGLSLRTPTSAKRLVDKAEKIKASVTDTLDDEDEE